MMTNLAGERRTSTATHVESCKIKEFLSIKAHTASDAINRIKRRDKRNYYE